MVTKLGFGFLCSFCVMVYLRYWWMFAFVVLNWTFFIARPRHWLGRTCPKWTVLCWVGRKTLTQYSANPVIARAVSQGPVWIDASYLWQAATRFHMALHCTKQRPLKYGIIRGWYTAVGCCEIVLAIIIVVVVVSNETRDIASGCE